MKLERFLQEKIQAGNWDSSGRFTIACDRALSKTASYSFTDSKHWLLKVVQAAVALECKELKISLSRAKIRVQAFEGRPLKISNFAEHLYASVRPSHEAEAELFLALKSLLTSHSFLIQDRSSKRFLWDKKRLSEANASFSSESLNFDLQVMRPTLGSRWFTQSTLLARESREYEELLSNRAIFAPLRLLVDGRRLSPNHVPKSFLCPRDRREATNSPAHLLSIARGEGKPLMVEGQTSLFGDSLRSREPFISISPSDGRPLLQFHLFVPYAPGGALITEYASLRQKPSFRICLGRLGVICHSQVCSNSPCSGLMFYELGGECGDLSGLQVAPTQADWERHRSSVKGIEPELERLQRKIESHEPKMDPSDVTRKELGLLAVAGGILGSSFSTPLAGLFGVYTLLGGGVVGAGLASGISLQSVLKHSRSTLNGWVRSIEEFKVWPNWKDSKFFTVEDI